MKITSILRATTLALTTLTTTFAGGEGWTHDWEAAKQQAAKEHKDLLLDFTGSDWCGWCIKLDMEVFQKGGFKKAAKEKFILVDVDFPNDTSKISQETQDQNKKLGEQFGIKGYPTILLCDASGKPFAQTGYQPGGEEKYVAHLDKLRANKTKRDNGLAAAAKLEGLAKAKALVGAINGIPDNLIDCSYADVVAEIKKADPKDETGFVKKQTMHAKLQEFEKGLDAFGETQDNKGALAFTDKALKEGGFDGESKQQISMARAEILATMKQFDDAIQALDEAKAMAPQTAAAKDIESEKAEIRKLKENGGKDPGSTEEDDDNAGGKAKPDAPAKGATE